MGTCSSKSRSSTSGGSNAFPTEAEKVKAKYPQKPGLSSQYPTSGNVHVDKNIQGNSHVKEPEHLVPDDEYQADERDPTSSLSTTNTWFKSSSIQQTNNSNDSVRKKDEKSKKKNSIPIV